MTEDDFRLFRDSVGRVQPVAQDRVDPDRPGREPVPIMQQADARRVMEEIRDGPFNPESLETGDELIYRKPGVQVKLLQQLSRGQIRIEAELDLHGLTAKGAMQAVAEFLSLARASNRRCIKIIHGKGLGSRDGRAVLKNKIGGWLRKRNEVLAYTTARQMDGGTGAIYVLLKKPGRHSGSLN